MVLNHLFIYLVAVIVLCTSLVDGIGKPYLNGYVYNDAAKGWLKYHSIPATWHMARLQCKYEGAVLASPLNIGILKAMTETIENNTSSEGVMFTGVHATFAKGIFSSVEGVPLEDMPLLLSTLCYKTIRSFTDILQCFADCLIFGNNGWVFTADCKYLLPYMCYKEDSLDMKESICGPSNLGYTYEERTNSCYKVHTTGRTWSRGYMTCKGEGGHLAIINSDTEAQVIKDLLKNVPERTILADFTHVASIGALDWGERGSWWTIHGETLGEAGYSKWENAHPDSKDQYCVGVNRSGKLNDIWCHNYTFPLVCEKKPI